ncbi:spore germination protein [Paenibacillus sp. J22TS3]|uniref:spore germination protein n=1 Tax=Paenibacillus sp. J22TS3 TaxID=2807192 RepID=UPI001BCB8623|nr:spore germination protein [Paenibacillus sp. J22TS3]
MFQLLRLLLGFSRQINQNRNRPAHSGQPPFPTDIQPGALPVDLEDKISHLQNRMGGSSDFVIRKISSSSSTGPAIAISYIEGLVDIHRLSIIMEALVNSSRNELGDSLRAEGWIKEHLPVGSIHMLHTENHLLRSVLGGNAVLMIDGLRTAFSANIAGGARRSVEEPSSQTVIRGPKEGFTEDIAVNLALLRRKIRSPDLRLESRILGRYTQTQVTVAYIKGVANPEVVQEISSRLDSIHTDSILESGYIEEFIQDGVISPFPTLYNTERPDTVAGGLLEGLVAVFVDGTPFALIAPVTFFRFIASSEDYYQRYDISSFLRLVRFAAFFVALLLPAVFIATTTFQQEMLPTTLLITLAAQRENTPLPALMEALIMELTFDLIREAGVRMPRAVGPAISIVGALVLGQAAVQAGIVSAAMVIVVSFTAICNFVLPAINMSASIRLLRFMLMILAGNFGLFGILAGIIPILLHLTSLQSFGVPYMMPLAPFKFANFKDLFFRAPWWKMKNRPELIGEENKQRAADEPAAYAQKAVDHKRDSMK